MNYKEILEIEYEKVVSIAIELKLITRKEWNDRFKNYRDEYGHSFIHYLECVLNKIKFFVTLNPIMLNNNYELEKRFGVKIITIEKAEKLR